MFQGHKPNIIDELNGLWQRGDPETCPKDHFTDCNNIQFTGTVGIETRPGISVTQDIAAPLTNIIRIYNFITQDANTLLVLDTEGDIYHVLDADTTVGPILTVVGMTDFAFIPVAGRAYISPFKTYGTGSDAQEKGIDNEFLYVYLGDGTPARKAAGAAPINGIPPFAGANSGSSGHTDAGFHIFAVVYESNTGFLTAPGPSGAFVTLTTLPNKRVDFSNIPVPSDVIAFPFKWIVATKIVTSYNGDETGYQLFFIPGSRIASSTTTLGISFYDADLLDDASHLVDNYAEIPAGAVLTEYQTRLILCTTFDDISLGLVSAPGEPEAISQIDGLIIAPLDGNPITNAAELRQILYVFKKSRTIAFTDNGDVPSSWPMTPIDQAIGCPVHGIATVVDSGSTNIDYLIVSSFKGINLFNGRYQDTELTWKIQDFWLAMEKNDFRNIQILNDSIIQRLYLTLPNFKMLYGDYSNGLNPKKMRWSPWSFDIRCRTIALWNLNTLIIGSDRRLFS